MANPEITHQEYYAQFITSDSRHFVANKIGLDLLLKSDCKHFNDIIPMSSAGGWIWDNTPIPVDLLRAAGETNINTPNVRTCIGKATARQILKEYRNLIEN